MADARTMKRGDTWPPLKGGAYDQDGLVDLTTASSLTVLLKSGNRLITGLATVINPPITDSSGDRYNWQYQWATGDTDNVGSYRIELEVVLSNGKKETFPNTGGPTLIIEQDNG